MEETNPTPPPRGITGSRALWLLGFIGLGLGGAIMETNEDLGAAAW